MINKIINGDCLDVLKSYPDSFFDSFLTDPPYGLKFMNKHWDHEVPKVEVWKEVFRTLKPGGHILVACGTRTQHRMAVNIEDAGFEIRDVISWIYGSGFPKSLSIDKAIDKQAGAEREVIGSRNPHRDNSVRVHHIYEGIAGEGKNGLANKQCGGMVDITSPSTDEAKQWNGWGTALKPATEFWTLARKPLSEKTVAENVLKHGTGGINVDDCRIKTNDKLGGGMVSMGRPKVSEGWDRPWMHDKEITDKKKIDSANSVLKAEELGRFPANVIFDEAMGNELDKQTGILTSGGGNKGNSIDGVGIFGSGKNYDSIDYSSNEGGASRFFYCPKADGFERNKGLKDFDKSPIEGRDKGQDERNVAYKLRNSPRANNHPTVKPIDLMRYLVRLITPKGGLTCDPYCGSGTTLIGAKLELINYIGIEREKEYCEIAEARVAAWNPDKYKEQKLF